MITSVNVYQFMYALLKMCVRICIHHWILYSVWYVCRTSCHQCHCVMCVSWSLLLTGVLSTLQFQCSYPQLGSLNNHSLDDSFTFVLEMLMWALLLISVSVHVQLWQMCRKFEFKKTLNLKRSNDAGCQSSNFTPPTVSRFLTVNSNIQVEMICSLFVLTAKCIMCYMTYVKVVSIINNTSKPLMSMIDARLCRFDLRK